MLWQTDCRNKLLSIDEVCCGEQMAVCGGSFFYWNNPKHQFSALSLQLCPATHAEILECYSTATNRGPRLTSGTKSATAVTRATCWKVIQPSPVLPHQRVRLHGTSPFRTAEVCRRESHARIYKDMRIHITQLKTDSFKPEKCQI